MKNMKLYALIVLLLIIVGCITVGCKGKMGAQGDRGDKGDNGLQGVRGPGAIEYLSGPVTSNDFDVVDVRIASATVYLVIRRNARAVKD